MDLWVTDNTNLTTFREILYSYALVSVEDVRRLGCDCLADLDGVIAECSFTPETRGWRLEKVRHDRQIPNILYTVERTIQTIEEDITLDYLAVRSAAIQN